jgi:hypothetical protein
MRMMLIVSVLVATLAVARVTRFIVDDQLSIGFRRAVMNRWGEDSWQSYLVTCPWCVSVWIALPIMPVAVLWPNRWVIAALSIAAASMVTGLLLDKG